MPGPSRCRVSLDRAQEHFALPCARERRAQAIVNRSKPKHKECSRTASRATERILNRSSPVKRARAGSEDSPARGRVALLAALGQQ